MGLFLMAIVMAAGGGSDDVAYRREVDVWHQAREARLRADGGWLTLAGLFWLKPGANTFGTDSGNDIVLPAHAVTPKARSNIPNTGSTGSAGAAGGAGHDVAGAAAGDHAAALRHAGVFVLDGGKVTVDVAPAAAGTIAGALVTKRELRSDAQGAEPDVIALGAVTLQVIDRQGRLGVRMKDNESAVRREFHGLRRYPVNKAFRVVAHLVPHAKPVVIPVPTVLGSAEPMPSPGTAWFELAGQKLHLDPVIESPGDRQLFFIFRDQTAGKTTYGSGRFLYADPPSADGTMVIDFNRAYSPPCAFTPYATCPLPPSQNRLPISVEAGELYDGHH